VYDKLELLKQKHEPIAEYIAKGYGRELQYHDSCVLEQLIKHFTKIKIPILTVHDSIICQAKHTVVVRDKMLQLYTTYVNNAFECATEYNSALTYASTVVPSLRDRSITEPSKLVEAINVDIASTVEKRYEGKLPILKNNVIEVSEESIQRRCSKNCYHYRRDIAARAGKRMFLGKIRIQTKVFDSVVSMEIVQ
jgi:hypothetical protein